MKTLQFAMLFVVGAVAGVSLMMLWEELHQGVEVSSGAAPVTAQAPGSPPDADRSAVDVEPSRVATSANVRHMATAGKRLQVLRSAVGVTPALPEPPAIVPAPTILTPPARLLPEHETPAPPPPDPRKVTLNAGTIIPVRLVEGLSIGRNKPGDEFAATLEQELIAGSYIIAERGARVEGRVLASDSALVLALTRIQMSDGQEVAIRTDSWERRSDPLDQRPATAISMPARTNLRFRLGVPVDVTERLR